MLGAGLKMNTDLTAPKDIRNLFDKAFVCIGDDDLRFNPHILEDFTVVPERINGKGDGAFTIDNSGKPADFEVGDCEGSLLIGHWYLLDFCIVSTRSFRLFQHIAEF